MLAMLQDLPGKVNDFNPIQFSEGTGEISDSHRTRKSKLIILFCVFW
jgi:hypothetical protein